MWVLQAFVRDDRGSVLLEYVALAALGAAVLYFGLRQIFAEGRVRAVFVESEVEAPFP